MVFWTYHDICMYNIAILLPRTFLTHSFFYLPFQHKYVVFISSYDPYLWVRNNNHLFRYFDISHYSLSISFLWEMLWFRYEVYPQKACVLKLCFPAHCTIEKSVKGLRGHPTLSVSESTREFIAKWTLRWGITWRKWVTRTLPLKDTLPLMSSLSFSLLCIHTHSPFLLPPSPPFSLIGTYSPFFFTHTRSHSQAFSLPCPLPTMRWTTLLPYLGNKRIWCICSYWWFQCPKKLSVGRVKENLHVHKYTHKEFCIYLVLCIYLHF